MMYRIPEVFKSNNSSFSKFVFICLNSRHSSKSIRLKPTHTLIE